MPTTKKLIRDSCTACFASILSLAAVAVLMTSPPAAEGRPANFSYLGCYLDSGTYGARDLDGLFRVSYFGSGGHSMSAYYGTAYNCSSMTIEKCSAICSLGVFKYFGLQYYCHCFCSNSYGRYGMAASESRCNTTCKGNHSQICGGFGRNSVYALTYPESPKCIGFKKAPRNYIAIRAPTSYTDPLYWTDHVMSSLDCTARCKAGQCEAVLFDERRRACHLLRYPLIPYPDLYNTTGEFYVRV